MKAFVTMLLICQFGDTRSVRANLEVVLKIYEELREKALKDDA